MSGSYDAVTLAMQMGLDRTNAGMVIPQMWITPATSDPYSPVTIMLVNALQYRLAKMGYANRQDGFVDPPTSAALRRLAGLDWKNKAWVQVYSSVLGATGRPQALEGLGMGYSAMGGLDQVAWCSTKHPQPGCSPLAGIVKPMTTAAATVFKSVQSQTNRVAAKNGWATIAVDGRLGPGTLALFNKCVKSSVVPLLAFLASGYPDVDTLAANADVAAQAMKTLADSLGAPAKVAAPTPQHPSGTPGQPLNPPNSAIVASLPLLDQLKVRLSSPIGMIAIGALVIGGLYYFESRK